PGPSGHTLPSGDGTVLQFIHFFCGRALGGGTMFKKVDYVMVTVSDMNRSVEFYRDKLGIPMKFQSPDWTEFLTDGTTLALHGRGVPQQPSSQTDHKAGACTFGFSVAILDKTYAD